MCSRANMPIYLSIYLLWKKMILKTGGNYFSGKYTLPDVPIGRNSKLKKNNFFVNFVQNTKIKEY